MAISIDQSNKLLSYRRLTCHTRRRNIDRRLNEEENCLRLHSFKAIDEGEENFNKLV